MEYSPFIIVPGASKERGKRRIYGALHLYLKAKERNQDPILLLSGYDYVHEKEMEKMVKKLNLLGYKVIVEPNSTTTKENALYAKEFVRNLNPKAEIEVITDTVHYGRTTLFFSKIFKEKVRVNVVAMKNSKELLKALAYELIAFPFFLLELFLEREKLQKVLERGRKVRKYLFQKY